MTQPQLFKDYRECQTLAVLSLFCHLNHTTLQATPLEFPWLGPWLFRAAAIIAITLRVSLLKRS